MTDLDLDEFRHRVAEDQPQWENLTYMSRRGWPFSQAMDYALVIALDAAHHRAKDTNPDEVAYEVSVNTTTVAVLGLVLYSVARVHHRLELYDVTLGQMHQVLVDDLTARAVAAVTPQGSRASGSDSSDDATQPPVVPAGTLSPAMRDILDGLLADSDTSAWTQLRTDAIDAVASGMNRRGAGFNSMISYTSDLRHRRVRYSWIDHPDLSIFVPADAPDSEAWT